MVGVAMREPVVFGIPDRVHLRRRNCVIQAPTPKICVAVNPSICCQHRPVIIGYHDRGADGVKEPHILIHSAGCRHLTITPRSHPFEALRVRGPAFLVPEADNSLKKSQFSTHLDNLS